MSKRRPLASTDLGFAQVDHDRARRCGFPEVILGSGKSPAQVAGIFAELAAHADRVLATRCEPAAFAAVRQKVKSARWHELARAITWQRKRAAGGEGLVAIVAAGTADLRVAEEARITASLMGARVATHYDVGVAGIHRLFRALPRIRKARVVVVVAGMEGALPSVVAGLLDRPVIAVPTSVGYGASFRGLAALLTMINSCAAGITVVNIDNGFGAGYSAALVNRAPRRSRSGRSSERSGKTRRRPQ
ncbi:MAG: nickel pincer cofactor biosynthesis protein LarB [Planctomycetes bacterium]|nr:nickel pincer cofactor biosynthesis protein LarB [Planctomycetota bacterium]